MYRFGVGLFRYLFMSRSNNQFCICPLKLTDQLLFMSTFTEAGVVPCMILRIETYINNISVGVAAIINGYDRSSASYSYFGI